MLSIPKYPEQYAQHFPTTFYLLCCASQHHVEQHQACRKVTPSCKQQHNESLSVYPVTQRQTHGNVKLFALWNFQKRKVQRREMECRNGVFVDDCRCSNHSSGRHDDAKITVVATHTLTRMIAYQTMKIVVCVFQQTMVNSMISDRPSALSEKMTDEGQMRTPKAT